MASSSGGFTASEVSRLVMGHLKTMNCNETSQKFVEECPPDLQLAQFSSLVDQGILRSFDVDGLNLVDILNEYKEMRSTLDQLLTKSLKPNELVTYKSDGPLRKLKILSDHWESKVKEANEKCAPAAEAEDSSRDPVHLVSVSSNFVSSAAGTSSNILTRGKNTSNNYRIKPKLNHRNIYDTPLSIDTDGVNPSPSNVVVLAETRKIKALKYKSRTSIDYSRSRNLQSRRSMQQKRANKINIDETAEQIQRELNNSNEESPTKSSNLSSKPSTSTKTAGELLTEKNIREKNVFKTPSAETILSPRKQSSRKSRVPTRKSGGNVGNTEVFSMPVISNIATGSASPAARENLKFTNQNDEKKVIEVLVTSKASVVGESIANELKSVDITKDNQENIVKKFMENQDQFDNLLNLLELGTEDDLTSAADQSNVVIQLDQVDQAPPSNCSSTCTTAGLAIDDASPMAESPTFDNFEPRETNEENHDMTSTPPPPEFDTEIYVQPTHEKDEFTEGNNLINSNIQTGTPSNTTSVKEKSPINANNNAKKIFDKRKNNDEEDQPTLDGHGEAISKVVEAFNQEYQSRRGSSDTECDTSPAKQIKNNEFIVNNHPPSIENIPAHLASKELLEKLETLAGEKNAGETLGSINASVLNQPSISNMVKQSDDGGAEVLPALETVHGGQKEKQPATDLVQPAQPDHGVQQPGPRRSSRIRKPKFEINPKPKKVRHVVPPKPTVDAKEKIPVEATDTPKKSLKISSVVESAPKDTIKANTSIIPKSTKKIGKKGSKLSLIKRTVNDLEDNTEHHLKRRLLAAFRTHEKVHHRGIQLVTPLYSEEVSVISYLKQCLTAHAITSDDIDQAHASGVDLSEVTLNDMNEILQQSSQIEINGTISSSRGGAGSVASTTHQGNLLRPTTSTFRHDISDHIIEDSVEEAILTVNKQSDDALEAEVIFAAETASEPIPKLPLENPFQILSKKKSAMAILAAADLDDQNLIQIAEECNRRSKADQKLTLETPRSQNKKSTMTISSTPPNLGDHHEVNNSQIPSTDSMEQSKRTPIKSNPPMTSTRALLMLSPESSNSLLKTPKKTPIKSLLDHMSQSSIDQALSPIQEKAEEAAQNFQKFLSMNSDESLSSINFKTPVKENNIIRGSRSSSKKTSTTPLSKKSSSQMVVVPNSPTAKTIEEALCTLLKTPVKEKTQQQQEQNNPNNPASSLKKTPLSKIISKKSPLPSPFLGSPLSMGGTPSKDISLASISFNQNEIHVTPSCTDNINDDHQKSLTLEISPEFGGGLHTPSPTQASGDGPLITPPLGEQHHGSGNIHDQNSLNNYSLTTSSRTPRGGISNEIIMNTPLKALSDAAKRLFTNEIPIGQNPTLVFLSPSKRKPKRACLVQVDTRSPLRSAHASNWEARHDVNNLDHYQSKVKEPIANERKRRTSQPSNLVKSISSNNSNIHPAKKPKPSPKKNVRFQDDKKITSVEMELVPQLTATPRKSLASSSDPAEKKIFTPEMETNEMLPKALGLVAKSPTNVIPRTPKTPEGTTTANKKSPRRKPKSVQRNLLDEDGFLSPVKSAAITKSLRIKRIATPPPKKKAKCKQTAELPSINTSYSGTQSKANQINIDETAQQIQRELNSKKYPEKTNLLNILSKTPTKKIVPPTKPTTPTAITKKSVSPNKMPSKLIKMSSRRTESLKKADHHLQTNENNPEQNLKVKIVKPKNKTSGSPLKVQNDAKISKQKTPVKNSAPALFKTPIKESLVAKSSRKSLVSPAKVRNAFNTPQKNLDVPDQVQIHDAVPPSPARSITKQPTALLSLSKTYEFYEQEPWGGESPDKEDSS